MNQYSISLGKIFGIPISIHWTFWILIIWILISGTLADDSAITQLWNVIFIFCVFMCVGFHELGHALMAKRYSIKTHSITFFPIGGVANISKIPKNPIQELMITIAGPTVNLVLAFIITIVLVTTGKLSTNIQNLEQIETISADNFLFILLSANIVLFIFNLIPAFPMDGGRILRALLAMKLPYQEATRYAVKLGQLFAILFVFAGLFSNPFLIIIAIFIFISAQTEVSRLNSEASLDGYTAKDIMMRRIKIFGENQSISTAASEIINSQDRVFLVKDEIGIIGYFSKDDIIKGLNEFSKNAMLKLIIRLNPTWISEEMSANEVLHMMITERLPIICVGDGNTLSGLINQENIKEAIAIYGAEYSNKIKEEKMFSDELAFNQ